MEYFYHLIIQRQSLWIDMVSGNNATLNAIRIRANKSSTTYLQPLVHETGDKEDKSYYHLLKLVMAGRSPKARLCQRRVKSGSVGTVAHIEV